VQQAISLAQRLNEKQKELDKARSDLNLRDADLKRTNEELLITQELLSKSKHPSGYLIESLETKEKENLNLKLSLNKIHNEYDYLKQENGDLQSVGYFLT
jgi:progesterone-induced-blocking factor 1